MIRRVNLNSIATGWLNWALDQIDMLDELTKRLAEKRLKICEKCEHRSESHRCKHCNCYLPAKASDPNAACPNNPPKW